MEKISLQQALEDMEFNAQLAEKQPEKQKEFEGEYLYANPNDFEAMKELYEAYGYRYSRSLWALQQVQYRQADEDDQIPT